MGYVFKIESVINIPADHLLDFVQDYIITCIECNTFIRTSIKEVPDTIEDLNKFSDKDFEIVLRWLQKDSNYLEDQLFGFSWDNFYTINRI